MWSKLSGIPYASWILTSARLRCFAFLAIVLVQFGASGCGKHVVGPDAFTSYPSAPAASDQATRDPRDWSAPEGGRRLRGARHIEGISGTGALWVIDTPARWNGELVVYLHGYTNPGEPIALPNNGAIRDSLLALGFAVTASSYSSNGYAVREGIHDSRKLSEIFAAKFGHPRRTYLFGQSLGGLIGMILSQRHPEQYDGSLLVCGIVGGSDDEIQYIGDIRVLFDTVYPNVLPGGLEHPPAITNINQQVVQPVLAAIQQNPQGVGIIQSLARRPLPGASTQEIVNTLITVLGFSMQGGGDLFERTHGQTYFDNAGWRYTSSALPSALLDDINARVARYSITPESAKFLERFGEPRGPFRIPVIALHTSRDPVVPVFHEDLLAQVAAGPMLVQHRVERYGHCTFSAGELMSEFRELVSRVGRRHKQAA